jgi:hypothetical protein
MSHSVGGSRRRYAALALAGALAVAGLWLAVGAGANGGTSARDAAYPVTYSYTTKIDKVTFGKLALTTSHKVTFRFHVKGSVGAPVRYVHTVCKRDDSHYKKCDSPKKYKHVHKGKHKFKVKAVYDGSGSDASKPDSFAWKVK